MKAIHKKVSQKFQHLDWNENRLQNNNKQNNNKIIINTVYFDKFLINIQ